MAIRDQDPRERARKILWDEEGNRRLPWRVEIELLLDEGPLLSDLLRGPSQFYFIPTREWVRGFVRLCKALGARRILEIGAGDGFVAASLSACGLEIRAVDIHPVDGGQSSFQVSAMNHRAALSEEQPDLVYWCWPPMGCSEIEEIMHFPTVRYYIDVGDGGHTAGQSLAFAKYENRFLSWLSRQGFGWIDIAQRRHHRSFLFYGHSHPQFKIYAHTPHPLKPHCYQRTY